MRPASRTAAAPAILLAGAFFAAGAQAHTPLFACYGNPDDTVFCEGGFSDGSSAAGIALRILDGAGQVLVETSMPDNSEFEFEKPDGDYRVVFDAGPGHVIEIDGADIFD
ncbi:MAG: hypothetical protein EA400_03470 [Chromatiaceae bacterium]|nr:MAG: hypothetical protein EA400_03470 [Chromatiaceae bacterium]